MKKRQQVLSVLVVFVSAVLSCAGAATSLQAIIDSSPESVIEVPAGAYQGPIVLKDDVFLVGAGADSTILEIPEGAVGVAGGHRSAILGFTVRGGQIGAHNRGQFLGVFECRFEGQQSSALIFENGGGVAVNNILAERSENGVGIGIHRSNPFIGHNAIVSNAVGVRVSDTLVPLLQENIFLDNRVAVLVENEAAVRLVGNRYSGNGEAVQGASAGESDRVEAVLWDGRLPVEGASTEQYGALMKSVYESAFQVHPCVIYGLGSELGAFDVVILWHRATFSIGASAPDTVIRTHAAYDVVTQNDLASQYRYEGRPFVDVINPLILDAATERYALENRYEHGPSLYVNEKGQRVFNRRTNLARVEIFCPIGWAPVSVNLEAVFDKLDGQIVVKITRPGDKTVEVILEPAGTTSDPLGLLAR